MLFLPSLVAYLSPTSTTILLRTYLLNTLALYIARGRPALPVAAFFDSVSPAPAPPATSLPQPAPAPGTLTPENRTPSAWLALAQSNPAGLEDALYAVSTPSSETYGRYLTREEVSPRSRTCLWHHISRRRPYAGFRPLPLWRRARRHPPR